MNGRLFAEAATRTLGLYKGVQLLADGRPPRRKIGHSPPCVPRVRRGLVAGLGWSIGPTSSTTASGAALALARETELLGSAPSANGPTAGQATSGGEVVRVPALFVKPGRKNGSLAEMRVWRLSPGKLGSKPEEGATFVVDSVTSNSRADVVFADGAFLDVVASEPPKP